MKKNKLKEKICNIANFKILKNRKKQLKLNLYNLSMIYNIKGQHPIQWKIKRAIDYTGSLVGIVLLFPIFLFIAAAIKLDSKGPVFYKQERIGLYGKKFFMYKFRSMRTDADKEFEKIQQLNQTNKGMFKLLNDPRTTKIGKFLRKYSLDEFPQLINVIKGEMSLVGPRPPLERELKDYEPWHYLRFGTIPGLTGLWQVSGRSAIMDFNKVVELDCQYITSWSALTDIKLLFKTIPIVILGKDAA